MVLELGTKTYRAVLVDGPEVISDDYVLLKMVHLFF